MADGHKIVFTFDTDTSSSFVFSISNATDVPLVPDLENVAQGIIDGDTVIPKKGNVTGLKKVEKIATRTTAII